MRRRSSGARTSSCTPRSRIPVRPRSSRRWPAGCPSSPPRGAGRSSSSATTPASASRTPTAGSATSRRIRRPSPTRFAPCSLRERGTPLPRAGAQSSASRSSRGSTATQSCSRSWWPASLEHECLVLVELRLLGEMPFELADIAFLDVGEPRLLERLPECLRVVDELERSVGQREALPRVEEDDVAAAVVVQVGVQPARERLVGGAELQLPLGVLVQVALDLPAAAQPSEQPPQCVPHRRYARQRPRSVAAWNRARRGWTSIPAAGRRSMRATVLRP